MQTSKAIIVRNLKWGSELPNQLIIRKGKLRLKNGKEPTFDIPDGMEVNVVPREDLARTMDEAQLWKHRAA